MPTKNTQATNCHAFIINLFLIMNLMFGLADAQMCQINKGTSCSKKPNDPPKITVCAALWDEDPSSAETKCVKFSKLRPGNRYMSAGKLFRVHSCGACPTPTPTPQPTSAPTSSSSPSQVPSTGPSRFPTDIPSQVPSFGPSQVPSFGPSPFPTVFPSVTPSDEPSSSSVPSSSLLPSSAPSITCKPALEVNHHPDLPLVVDITTPTRFDGIDDPDDQWHGYRANVTLDSYTIHMRFRLSPFEHDESLIQTLIQFREAADENVTLLDGGASLDVKYGIRDHGEFLRQDVLTLHHTNLFGGRRFDLRTNCWVDIKMSRNHAGEMKILINDGIHPLQSAILDDYDENNYHPVFLRARLQGTVRFLDYHGEKYDYSDAKGEIQFIKIYEGVVEDLTALTVPSSTPSLQPSTAPSVSIGPSSQPSTSSPTHTCGPSLEVHANIDPVVDISLPTSFSSFGGYRVNEVFLEAYSIHARFRLSQTKDFYKGTLIHFNDDVTLDANYSFDHSNPGVYTLALLDDHANHCLFDCNMFDIRTNCWVDLKVTRSSSGEMKLLLNDGIHPVLLSTHNDSERQRHVLHGNLWFFDDDLDGEIDFIKIYNGVVEDLTAFVII